VPCTPPFPRSLPVLSLSHTHTRFGRSSGGREGEDGEDEQAAVGHLAGGMGKYFTGSGERPPRLRDREALDGLAGAITFGCLVFYTPLCPIILG